MGNKIIIGKGGASKGGKRGNQMYGAHSLSAEQKNAAIKPKKKKSKI